MFVTTMLQILRNGDCDRKVSNSIAISIDCL